MFKFMNAKTTKPRCQGPSGKHAYVRACLCVSVLISVYTLTVLGHSLVYVLGLWLLNQPALSELHNLGLNPPSPLPSIWNSFMQWLMHDISTYRFIASNIYCLIIFSHFASSYICVNSVSLP